MFKYLLLLFFLVLSLKAETISIIADEWCPYNCSQKGLNKGYMIDIATEVFNNKGYKVKYISNISWKEAIQKTQEGKYDAIVGAYKSDAPSFIYPKNSLGVSYNVFFTKTSSQWKYTDIHSLDSIKFGAITGYSYGEEIDKYIEKYKNDSSRVQLISGNRAIYHNAKKLLYNTIDALIEDPYVIKYYFKLQDKQFPFKTVSTPFSEKIYIAFSPTNPKSKEYAKILSDGVQELRENGKLKEILAKYDIDDWE